MDDERERVWFEVTADIDPLSPILDWWVTVDRRIVGGGWPTWEDAPAATALRCVAAISGLMESWLHPAAASRYAPIRVEAGGQTGWVQALPNGWWATSWHPAVDPVVDTGARFRRRAVVARELGATGDWWDAVADAVDAAVASWVAGGTD